MEFETGAPNLTTAFDDNVSFFVISSNLTIHLSLFLAVCGVTCFVCNFRNPCTISAPKRRKKNEKVLDIPISSKDPSNTHNKKHLLSKMTPLEVIKCYLFKTNQYLCTSMYIFVENRQYFVNEERQKQPAKSNNDLDEVFFRFFFRVSIRLEVRSSFISIVRVIKTRKPQLIPCQ